MNDYLSRIIEHRKAKGLTQKQMAEKLGIGQVSYSQIETGKTEITLPRLARISNILDIDLVTLLWSDYEEIRHVQILKDENLKLKRLNNLLISQIERDTNTLDFIIQFHPETKELIESITHIKESQLSELINEIKKLNS